VVKMKQYKILKLYIYINISFIYNELKKFSKC